MSLQFGRCNFDRAPACPSYLAAVRRMISCGEPDADRSHSDAGVNVLYSASYATIESRHDNQPYLCVSGSVITWHGRLDNRAEILEQTKASLSSACSDVAIVGAAYEQWGTNCFGKFIGDWALSVWDPNERLLVLARDPIGTVPLYYSVEARAVIWSSILGPLVLLGERSLVLNEEYVAGWLSYFPATHVTPYVGIHSVPPSHFIRFKRGYQSTTRYWDFDPEKRIAHRKDAEYEEHFRTVFSQAVSRRLRSDRPILAELSGGLDSSSIVCMADRLIAAGVAEVSRLDTISYFDDSEPNWDERPYFSLVERLRGAAGFHIDIGAARRNEPTDLQDQDGEFWATPSCASRRTEISKQLAACLLANRDRVLLSGIGGDEVMGGVPTPIPELENLLATGRFFALVHQLEAWARASRRTCFQLLLETIRAFLPLGPFGSGSRVEHISWLQPDFIRRNPSALAGYPKRTKLFGPLPSFQENLANLDALRRQLACVPLQMVPPCERRYPYLDRDLLEFIYAVPREQIIRPGERRSLMRRALIGVVPAEILNRRRKAFAARSPAMSAAHEWQLIATTTVSHTLDRFIDRGEFTKTVERTRQGHEVPIVSIRRTLSLASWLRNIERSIQQAREQVGGLRAATPRVAN